MAIDRRKATLFALLAVLGVVLYQALGTSQGPSSGAPGTARQPGASSNGSRLGGRGEADGAATAPEVHLDALNSERPKPGETDRNLFRFKQKAPPPMPRVTAPPISAAPPIAQVPTGPPPPPPITLKFIGIVERPGKPKLAILSDGVGPPWYGSEGEPIAGRFKILRIGVESIELSYLDGRGRQTIRLTGS